MKSGNVVLGLLAGLAAGSLLGVLLAPDSGKVTCKKISKKGHDYADAAENKFNEFVDDITQKFNEVKDEIGIKTSKSNKKVK